MVVTNMWGNVDPETGASREEQLAAEAVKPAPDKDVQLLRHYNTTESAHDIIRAVLRNRQTVPEVQQELVDEGGVFSDNCGRRNQSEVEEPTKVPEQWA